MRQMYFYTLTLAIGVLLGMGATVWSTDEGRRMDGAQIGHLSTVAAGLQHRLDTCQADLWDCRDVLDKCDRKEAP